MIIAHIIGINSYLKPDFVTKMNEINVDVIDLDEITKRLLIKYNYNLRPDDWKDQIYTKLNEQVNGEINRVNGEINRVNGETIKLNGETIKLNGGTNGTKKYVVIGLTNFINDNRYKIKLDINNSNYFFIDIPLESCINQIMIYNLDTHRQSIISGEFPLKFLNRQFIEEQRLQLEEIYEKSHRKIKYDIMIEFINNWLTEYKINNSILYVTSLNRYETKLEDVPYAYNEEWLSLSSIAPKSMITRGIIDGKPIIKELKIGGFAELNKPGYVYEVKKNQNGQIHGGTNKVNGATNKDQHRVKLSSLDFIRRRYVSNILDELKRSGVIFENFKYN